MFEKSNEYPHIKTLINPNDPNASHDRNFHKLLDHATELSRKLIEEDIKELQTMTKEKGDDYRTQVRKSSILNRIK